MHTEATIVEDWDYQNFPNHHNTKNKLYRTIAVSVLYRHDIVWN